MVSTCRQNSWSHLIPNGVSRRPISHRPQVFCLLQHRQYDWRRVVGHVCNCGCLTAACHRFVWKMAELQTSAAPPFCLHWPGIHSMLLSLESLGDSGLLWDVQIQMFWATTWRLHSDLSCDVSGFSLLGALLLVLQEPVLSSVKHGEAFAVAQVAVCAGNLLRYLHLLVPFWLLVCS